LTVEREGIELPFPRGSAVADVRNKSRVGRAAKAVGLDTPTTLFVGAAGDLDLAVVPPPLVIKPEYKGTALARAHAFHTTEELARSIATLPDDERVVVQERAPGRLIAVALVLEPSGRIAAAFQQEASHTWPADAGPSRLAVSVPLNHDLVERIRRLLAELGYWGLAELQFMFDGTTHRLIDVNPRLYGSLSLAVAAGVNLPVIWHAVATGRRNLDPPVYRVGVTYRWMEAQIYAAIHGEVQALLHRPTRPRVGAFWSARDPVPALLLAGQALTGWGAAQVRRLRPPPERSRVSR
jgi:predicted ATP-grasp superfamily ATP-dependent carboligase